MSSMDLRELKRRGEATMAPSRCPCRQYDLENEMDKGGTPGGGCEEIVRSSGEEIAICFIYDES